MLPSGMVAPPPQGPVWIILFLLLQAAANRAVEKNFRKWELRFSRLHEQRLEVMEGMQERLLNLKTVLHAVIKHPKIPQEAEPNRNLLEQARMSIEVTREYFIRR